ncbi:hypothetical protein LTR50_007867 [Elasticomyces elasticus]|nr:hypothetical protein LTR50_007867 [Elasticomyces elasticus]
MSPRTSSPPFASSEHGNDTSGQRSGGRRFPKSLLEIDVNDLIEDDSQQEILAQRRAARENHNNAPDLAATSGGKVAKATQPERAKKRPANTNEPEDSKTTTKIARTRRNAGKTVEAKEETTEPDVGM